MLAVSGATGEAGGEVLHAAQRAGLPVRALVRHDPAGLSGLPADEVVRVDLDEPATIGSAFEGSESLFLLAGFADMPAVLRSATRAGVAHVILLSNGAADGDPSNALVAMAQTSEQALRDSTIGWSILRPSGFQSNALRWLPQLAAGNVVRDPFPEAAIAQIDPADIAAAAIAICVGEQHGRIYRLTGPEPLRPAEQVAIVAEKIGRPLRFEAQSQDAARAEMLKAMPAPFVDAMFRFFADGEYDDSRVDPTLPELIGRPAGTLADWATRNAHRFTNDQSSHCTSRRQES